MNISRLPSMLLVIGLALATPQPVDAQTYALAYTPTLSSSNVAVGSPVTMTLTPSGKAWPLGVILTPVATGLSGTFNPPSAVGVGTAPVVFTFTPSGAGNGILSATNGFPLVAVTAVAATPSGGTTPADGTLSGLPSTIVAGQPLSAASYVPTTGTLPYLVLYNVADGAEEGPRFTPGVMPGGKLLLLIPQTANAYTVRGFAAATGGSAIYESAQFNVTAAPGALPATPTQTADSGATSSSVTMNWSATAASYRVLGRAGPGLAYGSLVDATISTNSFTFTGQPASSTPRAAIIPQNANGYGTPSGQFLSFTTQ